VAPLDVLAARILWSTVFALMVVLASRRRRETLLAILGSKRKLLLLAASGLAISVNWFVFIWAVTEGHVLQASLGYFLNPLAVVGVSVVVLRERLRPAQWAAVALAVLGVAVMAVRLGALPWAALLLAGSFTLYGLARKTVPLDPVTGLAVETLLLAPVAVLVLAVWGDPAPLSPATHALLAAGGVVTALPLIWFAGAAHRLPFSTLGFFQYIAPTGHFLLAVLVYGETLTPTHVVTFGCIWAALALYAADMIRHIKRQSVN
jgi:rarD protein